MAATATGAGFVLGFAAFFAAGFVAFFGAAGFFAACFFPAGFAAFSGAAGLSSAGFVAGVCCWAAHSVRLSGFLLPALRQAASYLL